ncbi:hypothetical protein SNEBB_002472 [Seison nebaliae]|nr:hypothetical protein SNEBB_002472 [Seison nebaliae]
MINIVYKRANGVKFELHISDASTQFLYNRRSFCTNLNTTMLGFIDNHLLTFLDSTITDRKVIFNILGDESKNAYLWEKTTKMELYTNCNLWKNNVPEFSKKFVGISNGSHINSYKEPKNFATICGKMREDSYVSINFSTDQERRNVSIRQLSGEITDEMRNGAFDSSNGCYNPSSLHTVLDDYVVN